MVDSGPWGEFWRLVGLGEYDVGALEREFERLPSAPAETQEALRSLAKEPVCAEREPYVFIVLQNGAFGGKAVASDGQQWLPSRGGGMAFRNGEYTHPRTGQQSSWSAPVPLVLHRVRSICRRMKGVAGIRGDIRHIHLPAAATVYLDPPYTESVAGYGSEVGEWAPDGPAFVSEGRPLDQTAKFLGRRGGGNLNAKGTAPREEWLSALNGAQFREPEYMDLFAGLGV